MLLASVLDNGDAAVLAEADGVTDAGSTHALLSQLMTHAPQGDVRIRIVTTPDQRALDDARWAVRAFSAAGYPIDAVVVTRVPGVRDGWPKAWAAPQRDRVEAFTAASPVPVIALRLRPQRRSIPRTMPITPARALPVAAAPEPTAAGYRWRLPVDGIDGAMELRVGQEGGVLVLELDGALVRRPLPAVLARCNATAAHEVDDGIVVDFARDPDQWPQERA